MGIENNEIGNAQFIEFLEHIRTIVGFSVGIQLFASAFVNERHDDVYSLSLALKCGEDPQKVHILVIRGDNV